MGNGIRGQTGHRSDYGYWNIFTSWSFQWIELENLCVTHIHRQTHTHRHTIHTYTYMHTYIYKRVNTYVLIQMHIHIHIHMPTYFRNCECASISLVPIHSLGAFFFHSQLYMYDPSCIVRTLTLNNISTLIICSIP